MRVYISRLSFIGRLLCKAPVNLLETERYINFNIIIIIIIIINYQMLYCINLNSPELSFKLPVTIDVGIRTLYHVLLMQ